MNVFGNNFIVHLISCVLYAEFFEILRLFKNFFEVLDFFSVSINIAFT